MPKPLSITITPTDTLTTIDGVPCRLWEGVTADGVRCKVFVHLLAAHKDQDQAAFERALVEQLPPAELRPFRSTLTL